MQRRKEDKNNKIKSFEEWHSTGGVLITNYEQFRAYTKHEESENDEFSVDIRKFLINPGPDVVICDEGHLIKNCNSQINFQLQQVKTKRRIILTGTPLQNNLEECKLMNLVTIKKILNLFFT